MPRRSFAPTFFLHLTKLGERVGVSNQAVSKWENGNTSPDISLLPMIASALNVTLQELFESDNDKIIKKITADDYPAFAFDELHKSFFINSTCRFLPGGQTESKQFDYQKNMLKNGDMLGCISNKSGAVVIKDEFAFIDTKYKESGEDVFSVENASIIKWLSEPNVRKVLASVYSDGFKRSKNSHAELSLPDNKVLSAVSAFLYGYIALEHFEKFVAEHIVKRTDFGYNT